MARVLVSAILEIAFTISVTVFAVAIFNKMENIERRLYELEKQKYERSKNY